MLLNELEAFMDGLYELGCVKFGEFILSSGLRTPVYFDLRILISCPRLLQQAALLFQKYMIEHNLEYDVICGVPYGACGLATAISMAVDRPCVFKRKEAKDYGCKKMVEGLYNENDRALLIEDVVVYGTGSIEAAQGLRENGLRVLDVITLLDRQQGGTENCRDHGINFHSIIKADDLLDYLYLKGKITKEVKLETIEFLQKHTFQAAVHATEEVA